MNEGKLRDEVSRGARAQALLGNAMLKEAFDALEKEYIDAWRGTKPNDDAVREKMFQMLRALDALKQHLTTIVQSGELAAKELTRL